MAADHALLATFNKLGLNQKATGSAASGTSLISPTDKTYVDTASSESNPSKSLVL